MTNRREFLQTSVSVSSLPLAMKVGLPASAIAAPEYRIELDRVVFDDRYPEAVAFAHAAGGTAATSRALDRGDVTALWYDELDAAWRDKPLTIAGMTQFGPMFVLERLARERGLELIMRIEHGVPSQGTMAHEVMGPPETAIAAEYLEAQPLDWPVLAAVMVTHCPARGPERATRRFKTAAAAPVPVEPTGPQPDTVVHYYLSAALRDGEGIPWDGPLFTWLIAPPSRRA